MIVQQYQIAASIFKNRAKNIERSFGFVARGTVMLKQNVANIHMTQIILSFSSGINCGLFLWTWPFALPNNAKSHDLGGQFIPLFLKIISTANWPFIKRGVAPNCPLDNYSSIQATKVRFPSVGIDHSLEHFQRNKVKLHPLTVMYTSYSLRMRRFRMNNSWIFPTPRYVIYIAKTFEMWFIEKHDFFEKIQLIIHCWNWERNDVLNVFQKNISHKKRILIKKKSNNCVVVSCTKHFFMNVLHHTCQMSKYQNAFNAPSIFYTEIWVESKLEKGNINPKMILKY